ncbi:uncharacterized protein J8A68_003874 [[Candida] subhashii]|uniref:Uncharacterized protein n=1 Tax=[Candida] subhashii TaxID=561895 RepID=A0A8J5QGD8_9ASCO|nr:uncharacterized protein J8A68_003874 [[Candida] subhashii]KAG7662577.1 hypothetical protein J8A68_003874 [[Candida] subhashii]
MTSTSSPSSSNASANDVKKAAMNKLTERIAAVDPEDKENAENVMKHCKSILPNYVRDYLENDAKTIISQLLEDPTNVQIPVDEDFHPLIKSFLNLPKIKHEFATSHPYFLTLVKYPEIDSGFRSRVFDPEYLEKNFDETQHRKHYGLIEQYRSEIEQESERESEPQETGNGIFVIMDFNKKVANNTIAFEKPPPLSVQLHSEDIDASSRLLSFFYGDILSENLFQKSWTKEMTYDQVVNFMQISMKYFNWHQRIRGVGVSKYYICIKSIPSATNGKYTNCAAKLLMKYKSEDCVKVTYTWGHSHSYFYSGRSKLWATIEKSLMERYDCQIDEMDWIDPYEEEIPQDVIPQTSGIIGELREALQTLNRYKERTEISAKLKIDELQAVIKSTQEEIKRIESDLVSVSESLRIEVPAEITDSYLQAVQVTSEKYKDAALDFERRYQRKRKASGQLR